MQKYLTQHRLNAFTILLPRDLKGFNLNTGVGGMDVPKSTRLSLLNRFANFIQTNIDAEFYNLPVFSFLSTFYDVEFVGETKDLLEFNLIVNESLNKSMWLRLKHTVFNQYNALIGFSEVLKEVENLDDTDRLLIERINHNAREMYGSTKLLMEFEQLQDFNFELKSRSTQPLEYLSSYLRHRGDKTEPIAIDFHRSELEGVELNIDNELFKTSLDLFFDILKEIADLPNAKLQIKAKQNCQIRLECCNVSIKDNEIVHEIEVINDFYSRGIDFTHLSNRMFHLLYIKLLTEKMGGGFELEIKESHDFNLIAEWIFPLVNLGLKKDADIDAYQSFEQSKKNLITSKVAEQYPLELRKEIADHFSKVEGTYVLDDWKTLADQLDGLCLKYKVNIGSSLMQLIKNIRQAVDAFDVTAFQQIVTKLKLISNAD